LQHRSAREPIPGDAVIDRNLSRQNLSPQDLSRPTLSRKDSMRSLIFALTLLPAMIGLGAAAHAQNAPWCAHYDFGSDETVNCGFFSFRQCVDDVRGVGGFCAQNSTYGLRGPSPRRTHEWRR
jgi:hypothetical protein